MLTELAKGGRVIAPSHPGFGTSQLPKGMTTVDDLSYFYLDLLEQLDLRDVLVVGVGLGGWIAAEIAVKDSTAAVAPRHGQRRRHQDRRPRDPRHRRHLGADAGRVQRARLFRSEGRRARLQDPAGGGSRWRRRATAKPMRGSPGRPTCTIPSSRAGCIASSCRRCSCGAWPTASSARHTAAPIARLIAGARFEPIEQAGHFPHIEQPEEFARRVLAFADTAATPVARAKRA